MGHYRSEMMSDEELDAERTREEQKLAERTEQIQKLIDEKGLARFLAEMRISSWDNKVSL